MYRILIVDDAEDTRKLVVEALSSKYEVYAVESWSKALKHIFHVDLILLDIMLPGIKGDRAAKILLEESEKPPKVVLYSSIDERELRQKAKEVGAIGYISKTTSVELLQHRIQKFLS